MWHSFFSSRTWVRGGFFSAISLLLFALPVTVNAEVQTPVRQYAGGPTNAPWHSTVEAAAEWYVQDRNNTDSTYRYRLVNIISGYVSWNTERCNKNLAAGQPNSCVDNKYAGPTRYNGRSRDWCPFTDEAPVSGKCPDYTPTEPPVDPCADKNPFIRRWNYSGTGSQPAPGHFGGCVVKPLEMLVCRKDASGTSYCMWLVQRTGERYTGPDTPGTGGSDAPETPTDSPTNSPPIESPPAPSDQPDKGPCPAGTVHAGMSYSGIPMCIGSGTTKPGRGDPPKSEVTKEESQADGSTKGTTTTTVTNSDGSTTKTTTTVITRPDGTRETSQTVDTSKTPTGKPGSADSPASDDKYNLCKTNPNLSICREGSVQGECDKLQCVGDAVQCATLRAAAAMECRERNDRKEIEDSAEYGLGKRVLSGNDPLAEKLPTPGNGSVVDVEGIEAEGWLGGGVGLQDASFSLQGHRFVIPFSEVSQYLLALRYALMIVAGLISFRTLSGAILRE